MKKAISNIIVCIAMISICKSQNLPLTAGSGNPLTGDLYIDGTNGSRLIFSYSGVSNNKAIIGSNFTLFGTGSKDDLATYIRDNNPYSIWTNNIQRLVVNGSGNVGIGTSSPVGKLGIGDQSKIVSTIGLTLGSDNSSIELVGSTFGSGYGHKIYSVDPGNGAVDLRVAVRQGTTSWTDALTVRSNSGNVGIGTTTPDQLLSVNGTIHSKEVKVDLTGLPDYVFKPTYHLPTLAEVKTYIDKNQHLPEVPSAQEVEKNGLNLGEMNKLLLKKVEELTLYVIQLQKDIGHMKRSLKSLKNPKRN